MIKLRDPVVYTTAPVRNHITVELTAPVAEVWELVGDHSRLPEYSAGIESVDVTADGGGRTCRFRATDETPQGRPHRAPATQPNTSSVTTASNGGDEPAAWAEHAVDLGGDLR